jgi:hypothetical protein
MGSLPKRAEVPKLEPYFMNFEDAARYSGIPKKTIQNRISRGELPLKIKYVGSKPLIEVASLREFLGSLPSDPPKKRGRKRGCGGAVNGESTVA